MLALVLSVVACGTGGEEGARGRRPNVPLTFNRDIAPVIFDQCSPCHRPGQVAPFPLLDYPSVRVHAAAIADAVTRRQMPPWLPEPGYGDFVNSRRLSNDQIKMIERWVNEGAVEGDPADLPKAPTWTSDWQFGQPDVIVQMPRAYVLAAKGPNVFRNFVLPLKLPSGQFVRAVEFDPGNASVVHHAVLSIDRTGTSRRQDGSDGTPGFDEMFSQGSQTPEGHFLGWTPGRGPIVSPPGMSWLLERGTDLVVQLHLVPSGAPASVRARIGLFFTEAPSTHVPLMVKLGSTTIDIPAGERSYVISDTYVLPVDVDLLSVHPHAHYLASEMQATAALPDGTITPLIRIARWDFRWQQDYRYAKPLVLPRGTEVSMRYTYDNSDANSMNPNRSSRRVTYGPNATDEMGDLWLQVLPRSPEDAAVLLKEFLVRDAQANVAAGEMLVRRAPGNANHHASLGSSYLRVGRVKEATQELEEALRLNPQHADAHSYLGEALFSAGRTADAITHFRHAVALQPRDDGLHFNLANALQAGDRAAEAARELRTALAINADFAEAHHNLGILLLGSPTGLKEAIAHFERAIAIRPDYAEAHNGLAAALGEMGRFDDAIRHVRQALELRPGLPEALRNLELLLAAKESNRVRP